MNSKSIYFFQYILHRINMEKQDPYIQDPLKQIDFILQKPHIQRSELFSFGLVSIKIIKNRSTRPNSLRFISNFLKIVQPLHLFPSFPTESHHDHAAMKLLSVWRSVYIAQVLSVRTVDITNPNQFQ